MKRNTKILIGLGAVALGYYLYTKSKNVSVATQTPLNNGSYLMVDVDENYNKCVKEFESLPAPPFRYDPKQYFEEYIKECLKTKQPNYKPQTEPIGSADGNVVKKTLNNL